MKKELENFLMMTKFNNDSSTNFSENDKIISDEEMNIIAEFNKKIIDNSISLDPEIAKLIDENFWDLI